MEFRPKTGTNIMPRELEEGWFLLAEGIPEACMEEGSLTDLEEWEGFQGEQLEKASLTWII